MKYYTAYTMTYGESPCGCSRTTLWDLYDHTGNHRKHFDTWDEAFVAAHKAMKDRDADNFKVVEHV